MPSRPDAAKRKDAPARADGRRRVGRPSIHAPDVERSIVMEAAYQALAENLEGKTSVSAICARAGLSTTSFYRHFKSKDDLFLAMFEAEAEKVAHELDEKIDLAEDAHQAVREWIRSYLMLSFEPRRRQRTLAMLSPEVSRMPGYASSVAKVQERHRQPLIRALRAGAKDGSFTCARPENDAVLIQDILGSVLVRRRDGVEKRDSGTILLDIIDFLHRAIGLRLNGHADG